MTDAKALPDNLTEIAKTAEFQATYKANTVEQLESKLRELKVVFLSADNKNELVWRLRDATQSEAKQITNYINQDDLPANNTQEEYKAAIASADNETDAQSPENEVTPPADDNSQEVVQEVSNSVDEHAEEAEAPPAENTIADSDNNSDVSDVAQDHTRQPNKPANLPKKSEPEKVSVRNTGAFNILEPATVTMMVAGKVTDIAITPRVSKDKIMSNIEQFNSTRGNILKVVDQAGKFD